VFEATFAGCWPSYFRPLVFDVHGSFAIFVVLYVTLVIFAVTRIITALFIKDTLVVASNDADMMTQEKLKAKEAYVKKLRHLFKVLDVAGDGKLKEDEFELVLSNPKVKSWLQVLELDIHDAKGLFHVLDDGDGVVTFEEFLSGLLRLKGQARTMDVVDIMHRSQEMMRLLLSMDKKLNANTDKPLNAKSCYNSLLPSSKGAQSRIHCP
jgi:hypothetical protein